MSLKYNLDLQLHVQSVYITTNVVSSNPVRGKVYSMQHYVKEFVSDLRQVGGFLWLVLVAWRRSSKYSFNSILFIRPGIDPTVCSTRGEHVNHYTIDAVKTNMGKN
jgi:hypothetical protein